MSNLNDLKLFRNSEPLNYSFLQKLYSKVSLKNKKGKQLNYDNIKFTGTIDKFEIWYKDCNFDQPKKWFSNDQFYYSNFFCDSSQEAQDKINQYIKLSGLDNNLDSEIIATLNHILTEPIKMTYNQGIIIFFIEHNLKKNDQFRIYLDKWKNQSLNEKEIYQQIFDQVKDKYMIRLSFDICKKDQLSSSNIKLYFNNSFIKNYKYDITSIAELILKNNIYFKYFDKDIPLNSISLEYLFDVTKSYADVYYPQVSVANELNKENIDLTKSQGSLEINKEHFINQNILQDLKDLNDKNITNSKLSLNELGLLRKIKLTIENHIDNFKSFDKFINNIIKNEEKKLEIFGKNDLHKITNLDKVIKLDNFKNLKYPNWYTRFTKMGLKSDQNIEKYKKEYAEFNLKNTQIISKFKQINELIENNKHHILMPNYLDNILFQTFFDFNDFTLKELKKIIIQKIENNHSDKDKYIYQNKFNYNQLNISLTNYQLSNLYLESNIFIDGQILVYIPILNSEIPIFNINDILNQSLKDYQNDKINNLDFKKWLGNSGFFKNNHSEVTKMINHNHNNIHNFLNLVVNQIPAIYILIPINNIVNSKHSNIPFVKNLNFKNDTDMIIPDKNFNKLELINLVKFLIKNKQTISNIVFNNPKLDTSLILKYYNYIIDELNSLIKSIKSIFSNYNNNLIESKSSKMPLILKQMFTQYIKMLDKKKNIYQKLIEKISSWNDHIYQ